MMEKGIKYKRMTIRQFVFGVNTEEKARNLAWKMKYEGGGFKCPKCAGLQYWELECRPEIRQCSACKLQVRLRVGTIFENSKLPLSVWLQALALMMQGKRGISALELQRVLGLTRYETAWTMLLRIRKALMDRDARYKLSGIIELDGAVFGKKDSKGQNTEQTKTVFIAVETKKWVDEKGKQKSRAGFAQIFVDRAQESKQGAHQFVSQRIVPRSTLKTDGKEMYSKIPNVKVNSRTVSGDRRKLDAHLPWVHKFISNAKTWVLGTHHGIKDNNKYLKYYLAEYTYRFNRRHDPNSLFQRSLSACLRSPHASLDALTG